jgi:biopolymer transport protein ExbD
MKLVHRKHDVGFRPSMTPLIDIVFQLIVFFMVLTTITQVEVTDLNVPNADEGIRLAREPGDVTVNVRRDGQAVVSGAVVSDGELRAYLMRCAAEGRGRPVRVHVRGDELAKYASVRRVLSACAAAGITDVVVAVRPADAEEGETQ